MRVNNSNDFTQLSYTYATRAYVFETHGYVDPTPTQGVRQLVAPIAERLEIHMNFTSWRHRFRGSVGTALNARPNATEHAFGSWALKLWKTQCDAFVNLTAASAALCSGDYINETSPVLKYELNQQPEKAAVTGRLTSVVTERAAPGDMTQRFAARECPDDGCWSPAPPGATDSSGFRRWSDARMWECSPQTAGATIQECRPRTIVTSAARSLSAAAAASAAASAVLATRAPLLAAASRATASRRLSSAEPTYGRLPAEGDDVRIRSQDSVVLDGARPHHAHARGGRPRLGLDACCCGAAAPRAH